MTTTQSADEILDRTYLEMRARVLELAAAFDRIDRADQDGHTTDDPRMQKLLHAVALLTEPGEDRAEKVQMIFSDPYQAGWNRS